MPGSEVGVLTATGEVWLLIATTATVLSDSTLMVCPFQALPHIAVANTIKASSFADMC